MARDPEDILLVAAGALNAELVDLGRRLECLGLLAGADDLVDIVDRARKLAVILDHLFGRVGDDPDRQAHFLEILQRANHVRIRPQLVILAVYCLDLLVGEFHIVKIQSPAQAGFIKSGMGHEIIAEGQMKHRPFVLEPPTLSDVLSGVRLKNILLDHVGNRIIVNQSAPCIEQQYF